ncbi:hypothetical protein M758_6G084100 [Ceratodon purpureus]|nr:hypothetical protein M758_6G084100 [Ceratodon purpureus]
MVSAGEEQGGYVPLRSDDTFDNTYTMSRLKDERLQGATSDERQQFTEEFTGDGTVDRKGNIAHRQKTGGWRAAPLIFATEICERMGSLGLQRNLVTYFTKKIHLSNPKAANMVSNFVGALYLTPFIGGFLADAYWGRFWAITAFASIQVAGMVLLTLSAALPSLKPAPCPADSSLPCPSASTSQLAVLYLGLYLIALGNGGIKPNVSSMGADQFDESYEKEKKHMSSFFNWYYFIISIGSLLSVTVFVYIQDNVGFGWGFGIPAAVMILAIIVFFFGSPLYRYKLPRGSPLTSVFQVLIAAARKRKAKSDVDSVVLYEGPTATQRPVEMLAHTDQFRFLDKAAVPESLKDGGGTSPWRLCTVTQVEEVKMLLRLFPIWVSTIIVWTALSQMETFSVEEGSTMDHSMGPHFKFPPASLSVFELVNVLMILPLYDRFLVPFLRRFTGHPQGITQLQRIGTGILFSILAMVIAGFVEVKRVNVARAHGLMDQPKVTVPISIFWLIPQYFLRGSTEIFTQIGQLEFFYGEAPDRMRSLGTAIYLSTIACGHFLSSVLVTVVNRVTSHNGRTQPWLIDNLNRSRLDYFYWFLAILSFINFLFFLVCSHFYRYKQVAAFHVDDEAVSTRTSSARDLLRHRGSHNSLVEAQV